MFCINLFFLWWFAVCYRFDESSRKHREHDFDDEEDEEILGSDDDEQEDPRDYCKGQDDKIVFISLRI